MSGLLSSFNLSYTTCELSLREPFKISRGTKKSVQNVIVQLEKEGVTGYGEAAPNRRYDETAADVVKYLNALDTVELDDLKDPYSVAAYLQSTGKEINSARCALETAYLDWYGKIVDKPVYRVLNMQSSGEIRSSFTLGMDEPDQIPRKIQQAKEYPILKVKMGGEADAEIIKILSEETDKPLYVDVNEGWKDFREARHYIDLMTGLNVRLLEQPLPADHPEGEMQRLKSYSPFPLCADEGFVGDEPLSAIADCYDCINIKLMKTGSLVRGLQLLREARQQGLGVMTGCMVESSLADTATAILALESDFADIDGRLLIENDPFSGVTLNEEYYLTLSDRPGLGVTPRTEWKRCCN